MIMKSMKQVWKPVFEREILRNNHDGGTTKIEDRNDLAYQNATHLSEYSN